MNYVYLGKNQTLHVLLEPHAASVSTTMFYERPCFDSSDVFRFLKILRAPLHSHASQSKECNTCMAIFTLLYMNEYILRYIE